MSSSADGPLLAGPGGDPPRRRPAGQELTVGDDGHWATPSSADGGTGVDGSRWWALVGLADCHAHLSGGQPGVDGGPEAPATFEGVQRNAWAQLGAGVFLVADKGGKSDVTLRLLDEPPPTRPDLSAAGQVITAPGGYFPGFSVEVDEAGLAAAVAERAATRGISWVKLIGDWPRRGVGAVPNFGEDALRRAVEVAHAGGCRVAIHACAPRTSTMAVAAGIDSIEHGLFLTADDLTALGRRGGAWVPTVGAMEGVQGRVGRPDLGRPALRRGPRERAGAAGLRPRPGGDRAGRHRPAAGPRRGRDRSRPPPRVRPGRRTRSCGPCPRRPTVPGPGRLRLRGGPPGGRRVLRRRPASRTSPSWPARSWPCATAVSWSTIGGRQAARTAVTDRRGQSSNLGSPVKREKGNRGIAQPGADRQPGRDRHPHRQGGRRAGHGVGRGLRRRSTPCRSTPGSPPRPSSSHATAPTRSAPTSTSTPLIGLATARGCDCVHPGYGFLAENAAFAERCAEAGLTFIGPPPAALALFGDKVRARALARSLGIPVVAGQRRRRCVGGRAAAQVAGELGYPVMLKAAAGGGGRGMRAVGGPDRDGRGLRAVPQRGRRAAFGDGALFVERLVARPRHIEVQVLADAGGNVVHLHERDCSVQLRNQKVVEIAPAPGLDDDAARPPSWPTPSRSCRRPATSTPAPSSSSSSPETGEHFFIECNPRIQVEHTVTEQVTGVDLVEAQFHLAAGASLADARPGRPGGGRPAPGLRRAGPGRGHRAGHDHRLQGAVGAGRAGRRLRLRRLRPAAPVRPAAGQGDRLVDSLGGVVAGLGPRPHARGRSTSSTWPGCPPTWPSCGPSWPTPTSAPVTPAPRCWPRRPS